MAQACIRAWEMTLALAQGMALAALSDLHTLWTECLVAQACIRPLGDALDLSTGNGLDWS